MGSGLAAACTDPVQDDAIDALPPEVGVPDQNHRPGQPCVVCHSPGGPATSHFALAGTVYSTRAGTAPAAGVAVRILTADETQIERMTNAAGNFFVRTGSLPIAFPVRVQLYKPGLDVKPMVSVIGREASCAKCHFQTAGVVERAPNGEPTRYPATLRSVGPIYFSDEASR